MFDLKRGAALAVLGGAAVVAPLMTAGSATAATAPACQAGVTTHTEYKWVPDKVNAGPTQWTTVDAPAGTAHPFSWKGADVAYHRDGTKSTQVTDTTCPAPDPTPATPPADVPVKAPQFSINTTTCSVTVPVTEGIETRLYGVNGHPETEPITSAVTVTAGLDGAFETAPQFWIGYTAKPGYVLDTTAPGTGHIDFYNGDNIPDCVA